jgi:predicted small secreted protein
MMKNRYAFLAAAVVAAFLLAGCQTAQKSGDTSSAAPSAKSESPKAETPKAESPKDTKTVKGINGWEGEISGKPAPGSKFTKLQIGMSMKQVTDLIGRPNDQGAYVTGKAWIPFYYGSDRYRHELVYKSQGRLIFSGGSAGDYSSGYLTSIIHNTQEGGYR